MARCGLCGSLFDPQSEMEWGHQGGMEGDEGCEEGGVGEKYRRVQVRLLLISSPRGPLSLASRR